MDLIIRDLDCVITAAGVVEHADISIAGGRIVAIEPSESAMSGAGAAGARAAGARAAGAGAAPATTIDGRGKAAVAGLVNGHTHAAMTLLRGFADDMRLQPWLETRIWPTEARLTADHIYWGTRLAILEMIRSGTTFANDMYFQPAEVRRAFEDGGIRGAVGLAMFDFGDRERRLAQQRMVAEELALSAADRHVPAGDTRSGGSGAADTQRAPRVFAVVAPHSTYTCSRELLAWAAELAERHGLAYHIHMNETITEVEQSIERYGAKPFAHLQRLGVLDRVGGSLVAAHGVWLDSGELALVEGAGATVVHNPVSNLKLASGIMDYRSLAERGVALLVGPDGVASNNTLDMWEEIKVAALLAKQATGDPTVLPASEALALGVGARSDVFAPWGVGGHLAVGGVADLSLIDLEHPAMVPLHNIDSSLVYAGASGAVTTVVCDGEVVMRDREIPGAAEVIREARRCARELAAH